MGRTSLDKVKSSWRIKSSTRQYFNDLALEAGFKYADEGAPGELLDAIADGDPGTLLLVIELLAKRKEVPTKRSRKPKSKPKNLPDTP